MSIRLVWEIFAGRERGEVEMAGSVDQLKMGRKSFSNKGLHMRGGKKSNGDKGFWS